MAFALELTNLLELQRTSLQAILEAHDVAFRKLLQEVFDRQEGFIATLCEGLLKAFEVETSPFVEETNQHIALLEDSLVEEFAEGRETAKSDLKSVRGQDKLDEFFSRSMDLPARGALLLFILLICKSLQMEVEILILFLKMFWWTMRVSNILLWKVQEKGRDEY